MNDDLRKINSIFRYLNTNGESKKLYAESLHAPLLKVEEMLRIFESNDIEVRKIAAMSKVFKDSKELAKTLRGLDEYEPKESGKEIKEKLQKLLKYYQDRDEKGLIDNSNYLLELEKDGYFDDYNYSVYFVEKYIDYKDSIFVTHFLKENGLEKKEFERFVDVVSKLNPNLHEKYLEKFFSDRRQRQFMTIKSINDIYNEILSNNINDVEMYIKLPIYEQETDSEILEDFNAKKDNLFIQKVKGLVRKIKPDAEKYILGYIYKNRLLDYEQVTITDKEIRKTDFITDGKFLPDEDKEKIITFMKENRIPFLTKSFNIVKNEYLKGNIKLDEAKKLVK